MRAIANIWYGDLVDATFVPPPRRQRWAQFRAGIELFRLSREADLVITSEGRLGPPGLVALAALLSVTRRRTLAVMEFLPGRKHGILGTAVKLAYRVFLKRACVFIQAMTEEEVGQYERYYRIPRDVISFVPYYFLDERIVAEDHPRRGVFSSGRQSCDWDTLLAAAAGQGWDLTIVCSSADARKISRRAAAAGAKLLVDIPREEHNAALARAAVCVVALYDSPVSAGHTRLMTAASTGTPVILTDVRGSRDYRELAAVLVAPADPAALRSAVGNALTEPEHLARNQERVAEVASRWTRADYSMSVRERLDAAVERTRGRETANGG